MQFLCHLQHAKLSAKPDILPEFSGGPRQKMGWFGSSGCMNDGLTSQNARC
jgi:hypothetical protein